VFTRANEEVRRAKGGVYTEGYFSNVGKETPQYKSQKRYTTTQKSFIFASLFNKKEYLW
jgi:hypothetical protein